MTFFIKPGLIADKLSETITGLDDSVYPRQPVLRTQLAGTCPALAGSAFYSMVNIIKMHK
jgi:hypothetical protein